MSYRGYVPEMMRHLQQYDNPTVLEIGVDLGQTFIPLAHNLILSGRPFTLRGVDIKIQDSLKETLTYMMRAQNQTIDLIESNSLSWLPSHSDKYDLVCVDGDHNYYTVVRELQELQKNLTRRAIMVVDDYSGRWSERDLWYVTREGYESVSTASRPVETEKRGVKAAVDEFLASNPTWRAKVLMRGEPVLLHRVDEQEF